MTRVTHEASALRTREGGGVQATALVPAQSGSELALSTLTLAPAAETPIAAASDDTLLFGVGGSGHLAAGGEHHGLARGTSALLTAGEAVGLTAGPEGLELLVMTVGAGVDLHAPIGPRRHTVELDDVEAGQATGARSFQVLFGPHNGSTRATLFVGYIPPGRAPWHYHLYDEIVWVFRGHGALHLGGAAENLSEGSAFRLTPREVHIVENTQDRAELVVLGLFTPAGSPSAAYLPADVAATYAFAG